MTTTLQPKLFDLLRIAEAATAMSPTPATAWRHRDPAILVPPVTGASDPVLFLGLVTFQSEPFQPGAYFWGAVDPATGDVQLHVDVVDHPLDRVASYMAAIEMCRAVSDHLTGPHLDRRDRYDQRVDPTDRHAVASELPRVLVANTAMTRALGYVGRRFTYLRVPDDADATTRNGLEIVRAGGRWLRELDGLAKYAGQSQVVDVLEHLCELYVVPLPNEERGHLGAVCGAITAGPPGAWAAEAQFVGPVPDPQTQDELWELHNHLRDRLRGSTTRGPSVATTRARLQRRYESLARDMSGACRRGLELLARVPYEATQAVARRGEDLDRYAIAGTRAVGWRTPGRAVRPLLDNAEVVDRRELARTRHELRRLMLEPRLRAPLWAAGGAFDGVRHAATSRRVTVEGFTPKGKPKTSTEWEVVVEVHQLIELPNVGDTVLWCGHLGMQVQGTVSDVDGRLVTMYVPPKTSNASALNDVLPGDPDAWLVAAAPYLAESRQVPRDDHSALFRTPWVARPDEGVAEAAETEVDAVVTSADEAERDYG